MEIDRGLIDELRSTLPEQTQEQLQQAVERIVRAKRAGKKVTVVTGSGPNLHEGVTTLIAELIRVGVIDGVTTSSAVVAHEMAGTLDRVKRMDGKTLGLKEATLPRGGLFELTVMSDEQLGVIREELSLDEALIEKMRAAEGEEIIKAAGNMAYPMGYRSERIAREIEQVAKAEGRPFEEVAGRGADPRTMIGAGYRKGVPVLVSIPQLVGGGGVGLAIGDSISTTDRARRIAKLLGESEVILESAVALTQEIHDGPFETYTGHGVWADWDGEPTYSLDGKSLIRFDLDPNLLRVCEIERGSASVQEAIDKGLPKTKMFDIPFRMEMSGFARLPGSLPVIGDIGILWPILACEVAEQLALDLEFMSYPQQTDAGKAMRAAIVRDVRFLDRQAMLGSLV
ncbi:MAG: hypothetical protein KDA57_13730 [Planctomycetales bacterium]|nr:hypothetical protein [Planctomycetales bacterium]